MEKNNKNTLLLAESGSKVMAIDTEVYPAG